MKNGAKPDVILLDIMMPGMNGWEVFDMIKDDPTWKDIPIVFFSARSDDLARETAHALGNGYIEKPVESEVLVNHINQLMHR
jgi:putative two-component system response regulator